MQHPILPPGVVWNNFPPTLCFEGDRHMASVRVNADNRFLMPRQQLMPCFDHMGAERAP